MPRLCSVASVSVQELEVEARCIACSTARDGFRPEPLGRPLGRGSQPVWSRSKVEMASVSAASCSSSTARPYVTPPKCRSCALSANPLEPSIVTIPNFEVVLSNPYAIAHSHGRRLSPQLRAVHFTLIRPAAAARRGEARQDLHSNVHDLPRLN
jgi:hypothetical protein